MVGTRASLCNGCEDEVSLSPAPPKHTSAVARDLRKLEIHGTEFLKGGALKKSKPSGKTYHWRGAVYDVTEDTPPEWVQSQPKRYQKRITSSQKQTDNESRAGRCDSAVSLEGESETCARTSAVKRESHAETCARSEGSVGASAHAERFTAFPYNRGQARASSHANKCGSHADGVADAHYKISRKRQRSSSSTTSSTDSSTPTTTTTTTLRPSATQSLPSPPSSSISTIPATIRARKRQKTAMDNQKGNENRRWLPIFRTGPPLRYEENPTPPYATQPLQVPPTPVPASAPPTTSGPRARKPAPPAQASEPESSAEPNANINMRRIREEDPEFYHSILSLAKIGLINSQIEALGRPLQNSSRIPAASRVHAGQQTIAGPSTATTAGESASRTNPALGPSSTRSATTNSRRQALQPSSEMQTAERGGQAVQCGRSAAEGGDAARRERQRREVEDFDKFWAAGRPLEEGSDEEEG